ncbi:MAG TPA: hypothetical protein VNN72_00795 [Polyangiaceae bacterium]|nr:hypothetical protein [Polyangiaceae bacterium]
MARLVGFARPNVDARPPSQHFQVNGGSALGRVGTVVGYSVSGTPCA